MAEANPVRERKKLKTQESEVIHDHVSHFHRMARIKGQVEGIDRMLKESRYCPDILQQIKSVRSALHGLETAILERHLRGCVKNAFMAKDPFEAEKKMNELMDLITTKQRG